MYLVRKYGDITPISNLTSVPKYLRLEEPFAMSGLVLVLKVVMDKLYVLLPLRWVLWDLIVDGFLIAHNVLIVVSRHVMVLFEDVRKGYSLSESMYEGLFAIFLIYGSDNVVFESIENHGDPSESYNFPHDVVVICARS
ncbi:unnamed protein product [Lepeophtheirus salmonis]|uniref:(salmon louse) hypothetical protein n=1 Tax=Lepeophtheirus salmonis TaxID=72036 RepID=A0A7R8CPK4_LEPSM|nr:unnamed protein product [Lepeophtheirus salmonis]CAF2849783.1 unnamed protein product [Lepeophtheirus salmonis]